MRVSFLLAVWHNISVNNVPIIIAAYSLRAVVRIRPWRRRAVARRRNRKKRLAVLPLKLTRYGGGCPYGMYWRCQLCVPAHRRNVIDGGEMLARGFAQAEVNVAHVN